MAVYHNQLPTPLTPSMPLCVPHVQDAIDSLPMTPPDLVDDLVPASKPDSNAIKMALHVISTERAALAHLESLYENEAGAQTGICQAIDQIADTQRRQGKLVIVGVGKSGKIGHKLVATFNSLGIQATFLHPTEALHGDLGVIKATDTVMMITFSGRTPELLTLLPHISTAIPLIVLTNHVIHATCPLIADRVNSILIPAPIHEPENVSFGLSAPTSSTTVALAIGDALALTVAVRLHTLPGKSPADIFQSYHPGGAIGAAGKSKPIPRMSDLAVQTALVPLAEAQDGQTIRQLDVLLAAVRAPGGWVKVTPEHIIAPRRIQRLRDLHRPVHLGVVDGASLAVEQGDWISVLGDCPIEEAKHWILNMRMEERGRSFLKQGTILGIVDKDNEVSGVVEIEDVVGDDLGGGLA